MFHGKNWRAKIFLRTRTKTPPEKEGDFKGEGEKCFGETGTCVVGGCAVLVTRLDGSAVAGARNGWIVTRVVRRGAILLTSLPPHFLPHNHCHSRVRRFPLPGQQRGSGVYFHTTSFPSATGPFALPRKILENECVWERKKSNN